MGGPFHALADHGVADGARQRGQFGSRHDGFDAQAQQVGFQRLVGHVGQHQHGAVKGGLRQVGTLGDGRQCHAAGRAQQHGVVRTCASGISRGRDADASGCERGAQRSIGLANEQQ